MRRIISLLTVFALLLPIIPVAYARDVEVYDSGSYIEHETGDTITIEAVSNERSLFSLNRKNNSVYTTIVFRNGIYETTICVDFDNNLLTHEYADGSILRQNLSDVVTITALPDTVCSTGTADKSLPFTSLTDAELLATNTDYVTDEPLYVSLSGVQAELTDAPIYSGYRAMGCRGGYFYPPDYGYLQRRNDGVARISYARNFEFSAGTTVSTAVSIISAAYARSLIEAAIEILLLIVNIIVEVIDSDWGVKFEVNTFKWSYRVRLNSNTGEIIATSYRSQDYWKGYNPATGELAYNYRGSAHDTGFLMSNDELIRMALCEYQGGL